ncbi:hypothetical protein FJZ53_01695 [Candidatus Woesearchaeota archaeon]|nr:hypothetical protein [Candidatus Woesearchaeota archaeon]
MEVVYKEKCFHGALDRMEGTFQQNIMEVVAKNGKKFRFRNYSTPTFITALLEEGKEYSQEFLNEIVIKEEGKKTLSYNARNIDYKTVKGMRIKIIFDKANALYNGIRCEIMNELKEQHPKKEQKPEPKKLEKLVLSKEEEDKILEEATGLFDTGAVVTCLYKGDAEEFIKTFSKIDKLKKKELLSIIFNCGYENKEVIEWLNKNEQDLLREVGLE